MLQEHQKNAGLLLNITGNGKGKSTSAFGITIRALGWGWKVLVLQFVKGDREGVLDGMHRVCLGVDLLIRNGGIPAGKAMMLLKGIDCGKARLPLKQLEEEERRTIAGAMAEILRGSIS